MRIAILIAVKDLRQRLRDRSAIVASVIAPLGLAIIFSQLLGGATDFRTTWTVANLDGGQLAQVLRTAVIGPMTRDGAVTVTDVATEAEARSAVTSGASDAAFIIPAGFTTGIEARRPVTLEVVGAQDASLSTEVARSLASRFGDGVVAIELSVATVQALASSPPGQHEQVAAAAASAVPPAALVDEQAALRQLTLPTYFSAAMSILFLFFSTQIGMVSLFEERREGTLARILAGPVRPETVLAGKTLASFAMGLVAMVVLVAATTALIHADWGPPLGVGLIVVAAIAAAIGIGTLVTSFTRTAESAGAANSAIAVTLGILGGTFSPTAQAPDVLATLSLLTPHGWFLRGLGDMHGAGSTAADALPSVAVLLAMALVTGGIGVLRARRLVAPR